MDRSQYNISWWRGAGRAILLRCPRCGRGKVFRRFLLMKDSCSECGLVFDRGDGYWLGSMMFNMAFAMGTVAIVGVAVFVVTSPEPNWDLTIVLVVASGLLSPVLFFPFSRTLWIAAERAARLRDGTESE